MRFMLLCGNPAYSSLCLRLRGDYMGADSVVMHDRGVEKDSTFQPDNVGASGICDGCTPVPGVGVAASSRERSLAKMASPTARKTFDTRTQKPGDSGHRIPAQPSRSGRSDPVGLVTDEHSSARRAVLMGCQSIG